MGRDGKGYFAGAEMKGGEHVVFRKHQEESHAIRFRLMFAVPLLWL